MAARQGPQGALRLFFRPATGDHIADPGSIPLVGIPSFVELTGEPGYTSVHYFAVAKVGWGRAASFEQGGRRPGLLTERWRGLGAGLRRGGLGLSTGPGWPPSATHGNFFSEVWRIDRPLGPPLDMIYPVLEQLCT